MLLLGLAFHFPVTGAQADAVFTVDTAADTVDIDLDDDICADINGDCSLRAAVMQANALPGADTIQVPPGVYTLTIPNTGPDGENEALTGDLDVTDDLTITGTSGDPANTIIQAGTTPENGIDKVLSVNPTFDAEIDFTITGLTIRHGRNAGSHQYLGGWRHPDASGWGGGMDWDAGTGTGIPVLTIDNCRFVDNTTLNADGGGLSLWNAYGGRGQVVITNTLIQGNNAPVGAGGGLFVDPFLEITITDSTIDGNWASHDLLDDGVGGGIFQAGVYESYDQSLFGITRPLIIHRSTISNNRATGTDATGGGIFFGAGGEVYNSTISGNTSTRTGGGVSIRSIDDPDVRKTVTLTNVTVTNNRSDADDDGGELGGGIWIDNADPYFGHLVLVNSLVQGNFSGTGVLIDNLNGPLQPGSTHNLTDGPAEHLGPLADNGGPTLTHALLPGSPAMDAGDTSLAVGDFDQRGFARAADAADSGSEPDVDIGAFEAYPSINPIDDQQGVAGVTLDVPFRLGSLLSGGSYDFAVVSDNPTLLPNNPANMSVSGTGADRELHLTPALGQKGTAQVTVTVSDGAQQVSESFLLSVVLPPDLTLSKTHSGEFIRGQSGGVFTLTVSNIGDLPTSGTVTVVDTLPAGLTAASMTGSGWNCTLVTLTCTRANALAAGASYPPITLAVSVTANAPDALTNNAAVSGGAELDDTNNAASDTVLLNTRLYLPIIRRP